jgi:hypothetical protein
VNWTSWLLSGFVATLALSIWLTASQGFGFTRMNIPFLIGTFVTADRRRAKAYGFLLHLLNGWAFSLLYVLLFQARNMSNWWFGTLLGLAHAILVLTVGMSLMPSIHPRMATEQQGPDSTRKLEPPGFLALHYGLRTPISVLLAHGTYGAILGSLYHLR